MSSNNYFSTQREVGTSRYTIEWREILTFGCLRCVIYTQLIKNWARPRHKLLVLCSSIFFGSAVVSLMVENTSADEIKRWCQKGT